MKIQGLYHENGESLGTTKMIVFVVAFSFAAASAFASAASAVGGCDRVDVR